MRYLSVCSGIEAASVAWESLGWTPIAFAEIEKFPSQVLAHHFPHVPNLGDMTKYKEWNLDRNSIDLIVGGTPCQSFSVAGLRKGLEDPRGNLALTFLGMVDHYKPEWVVWENVPGVLSSSGGRDFGSFLGALGQLGYGFAYRVLDAQYFGVPQRRRRVFVVAHSSGDPRRAAQILFEPESLRGNPPKSRASGQDTAQCLTTGTGCRYDPETETLIPVTFRKSRRAQSTEDFETWVPDDVTNTLNCFDVGDVRSTDLVVQAFNHQSGGDMRGIDPRPTAQLQRQQQTAILVQNNEYAEAFAQNQLGELRTGQVVNTIGTNSNASGRNTPMVVQSVPAHTFKIRGQGHYTGTNGGLAKPGGGGAGYMGQDEKAYTISTTQDQYLMQVGSFKVGQSEKARSIGYSENLSPALTSAVGGNAVPGIHCDMAVRRLTPVECERLQGFPDGWTDIQLNGKETPDGPRYKAIGNSMAVPVMDWLGKRINEHR